MSDRDQTNKTGPNLLERTIAFVSPETAVRRAASRQLLTHFGYDSANPEGKRGSSGGISKNASSESGRMQRDRLAVMWDARDLVRNMPVLACAIDRLAQYTVSQVNYRPTTGDSEIDKLYSEFWEKWSSEYADYSGRHDFRTLIELGCKGWWVDGDHGFIPQPVTMADGTPTVSLQAVESDRIGNPMKAAVEQEGYTCGIRYDPRTGRPTDYEIYFRSKMGQYKLDATVEAGKFIHLILPRRSDQYRGVSLLAPVLSQARDLYEFFSFERGAAKWAASIAGVIYEDGPTSGTGAGAAAWDGLKTDGTPTSEVQQNKLLRLRGRERVMQFDAGSRPSGAFSNYIEAALRDISMGLNLPYGFFDMRAFGGVSSRLETQQVMRTVWRYRDILVPKVLNRVRDAVFGFAVAHGTLPATPNWRRGKWHFGAHLTADIGHQTSADILHVQNLVRNRSTLAEEQGGDFEQVVDTAVKEAVMIRDKAGAAGIPMELVMQAMPQATQLLSDMEASRQPPPPTSIETIGDKGVGQIAELLEKVATGVLPRDSAILQLIDLYKMDPMTAARIVPEEGSAKPQPQGGGEGRPVDSGKPKAK